MSESNPKPEPLDPDTSDPQDDPMAKETSPSRVLLNNNVMESTPVSVTSKRVKMDVKSLPTRQYLDQTVVPILLEGLAQLAKDRPSDPIDYLVAYLQKHKHEYE